MIDWILSKLFPPRLKSLGVIDQDALKDNLDYQERLRRNNVEPDWLIWAKSGVRAFGNTNQEEL